MTEQRRSTEGSGPPRTRAEFVDRKLREAIVRGDLGPGERLRVSSLGERWSVSPTPLREAFQRLAVEGLLELIPQRGARVAPVSIQEALEVHELRLVLEPLALRSSMGAANDQWLGTLERTFSRLATELSRPTPDRGAVENAHRAFHLALLANCTSSWLSRIIDLLMTHVIRYWTLTAAPRRNIDEVVAEHRRLVDLCVAGDEDAAAKELTIHLEHAFQGVSNYLDTSG